MTDLIPPPIIHAEFDPILIPFRDPVIQQIPSSPLLLFQLFLPIFLVEKWVKYTNEGPIPGPYGPPSKHSSKNAWTPISIEEVYVWIGILIYIGIHKETRLEDHWKTSKPEDPRPDHFIITLMSFKRFKQILRRLRIFNPFLRNSYLSKSFQRVNEWSLHIQAASLAIYKPGTNIAVDECMIRYQGRSFKTTFVPRKPIPIGFKAWVVAQAGYFLQWQFYMPPSVIPQKRKRPQDKEDPDYLAPTQAVVLSLVNQLENANFHVFTDNLFSTTTLFRLLRQCGHAATGTCRTNSGIGDLFVQAKKEEKKWPWGQVIAALICLSSSLGEPDRVERQRPCVIP